MAKEKLMIARFRKYRKANGLIGECIVKGWVMTPTQRFLHAESLDTGEALILHESQFIGPAYANRAKRNLQRNNNSPR